MTANQIAYMSMQENKRHNLSVEAETVRSNMAKESHNISALEETKKHNRATEGIAQSTLSESIRHNVVGEQHNSALLAETKRANLAKEYETSVHNRNVEMETSRSNVEQEKIQRDKLINDWKIGVYNAETQRYRARIDEYAARQAANIGYLQSINSSTSNLVNIFGNFMKARPKSGTSSTNTNSADNGTATIGEILANK